MRLAPSLMVALLPLTLLGACHGKVADGNALAALDARLTNDVAGVAGSAAPARSGDENGAADMATGADLPHVSAARSLADARGARGVPIRQTHAAMQQLSAASGRETDRCGRQITRGLEWAARMPAPFSLYPGATLVEAAGVTNGRCALRLISFTTADAPRAVIAHYGATAREAGFDAEHQLCKGEERLGGTRAGDEMAYIIFVRRGAGGGSNVDIVTTAGT